MCQKGFYCETLFRSLWKFCNSRSTPSYTAVRKTNEIKTTASEAYNRDVCEKVPEELAVAYAGGSEVQITTSAWKRRSTKCYNLVRNVSYVTCREIGIKKTNFLGVSLGDSVATETFVSWRETVVRPIQLRPCYGQVTAMLRPSSPSLTLRLISIRTDFLTRRTMRTLHHDMPTCGDLKDHCSIS
jgi:hypothetical protein